eukprot:NODE_87_length_21893_cov_0.496559.p13 type:complete len:175 gc:universal NODE_87_length_21893_cov_0.496559:4628-5152(+)
MILLFLSIVTSLKCPKFIPISQLPSHTWQPIIKIQQQLIKPYREWQIGRTIKNLKLSSTMQRFVYKTREENKQTGATQPDPSSDPLPVAVEIIRRESQCKNSPSNHSPTDKSSNVLSNVSITNIYQVNTSTIILYLMAFLTIYNNNQNWQDALEYCGMGMMVQLFANCFINGDY